MQKIFMNKKRCMAAAVCLALMITAGMPAGVSAEAVDVQLPSSGGAVSGPLLADTITASSTLEDGSGFNYSADCLQDYNSNTAWVEGVQGNGIGEFLTFTFPEGTVITGGVIYTGYQKSADLLFANSAPAAFCVESGSRREALFLDSYADTFLGNEKEGYLFRFDEPIVPENGVVTVTITSVRPGWKYEDTCISEFRFTGYNDVSDAAGPSDLYLSDSALGEMRGFCQRVCDTCMGNDYYEGTIRAEDLTAQQQAFLLYWYQYCIEDYRICLTESGEWHTASKADLGMILQEMFGTALKSDALPVFLTDYAEGEENGLVRMAASGDFGDAGSWYFDQADDYWMEGDLIGISGRVMGWNSNAESYVHQDMYTGYLSYTPSDDGRKRAFRLDHVTVGF